MGASNSGALLAEERAEFRPLDAGRTTAGSSGRAARAGGGLERAMRAHPAGRALPPRSSGGRAAVVARPPLRLTARGRLLLAALGLALAVGSAGLVGGMLGDASGDRLHLAGESSVVVHQGDTLWSIAGSMAGDADVRTVVARIQQVNGLHGAALTPGQVLRLP